MELFEAARKLFDSGEYFEAHEVWEDMWNQADGPRHAFLQCLIQVAAALHHARNGNLKGTRKLMASALGYLDKGRADSHPVDMDRLRDHILDIEIAIQAGHETLPYFKLPLLS